MGKSRRRGRDMCDPGHDRTLRPATVSAATSTPYHRTLMVGSGSNAGHELYMLTFDQPGVTRTDILAGMAVEQVTYGGLPVYQLFLNTEPGQTHGANLFDPFTNLPGIWYLQSPGRGLADPGVTTLSHETV